MSTENNTEAFADYFVEEGRPEMAAPEAAVTDRKDSDLKKTDILKTDILKKEALAKKAETSKGSKAVKKQISVGDDDMSEKPEKSKEAAAKKAETSKSKTASNSKENIKSGAAARKTGTSAKAGKKRTRVSPVKKKLALEVIERLKAEYPVAECTLDYENAWQLLVSVRLAAQCTDARVDQITPLLYAKFPDVPALAAAEPEEIEEIVRPCGLGRSKARDISACMRVLHEKYDDHVPDTFEELLSLPGVGRKSANLIMGDVFGKPAIVTDTHCIRLCNLIGLVDDIKEPAKVERELWKIVPPEEGNDLCHRFVHHGRAVCVARRPQCAQCCLKDICRQGKTV